MRPSGSRDITFYLTCNLARLNFLCVANSFRYDKSALLKNEGAVMAKKKKSVRRAWTPSDVRELKSLAKKKVGVAKISKALKRTVGATAVKAHQLGVSLDTRG
jgi:hypothetical protein